MINPIFFNAPLLNGLLSIWCIKYILYGIQESFYPISIQKIDDVINEYKNVIKTDKPVFCGPSSITLQIENLDPLLTTRASSSHLGRTCKCMKHGSC